MTKGHVSSAKPNNHSIRYNDSRLIRRVVEVRVNSCDYCFALAKALPNIWNCWYGEGACNYCELKAVVARAACSEVYVPACSGLSIKPA